MTATAAAGVRAPFKVGYDLQHLDLAKHELQFTAENAVTEATLVVFGEDGKQLGTGEAKYDHAPANTWLAITWTQPEGARVATMKLRVVGQGGIATNVELVPWSVTVDHEDVNFKTDSADIDPDEAKKLDASLGKIQDVVKRAGKFLSPRLYIAGHTDTVGPSAKNRTLSLARARAIASYFRQHGIAIPIVFAGFGEDVLKVKTADEVDERANRRADYILGPGAGAPPFGGAYTKARADWKQLK